MRKLSTKSPTVRLEILIPRSLRDDFNKAVDKNDTAMGVVLRKFIKTYVKKNT